MEVILTNRTFASVAGAQGTGDQRSMAKTSSCTRTNCSKKVVTRLEERNFCFDHFCNRCYELLERIDGRVLSFTSVNFVEALAKLDECAQRALEISLSEKELNNLDRARLLDILLWSGDLTALLRRKRNRSKGPQAEEIEPALQATVGRGQSD